ncbi:MULTISPECIES: flavin-containing monooxygenase [unclassified Rhodococcus (in: high G+C Gram-positive bacteria)]|uniref:flavin-containing monooxygenase n=1 Tax=unclassified Rhodococcus (in: high G+C Gram-positive bacteria) TaxID=192944 RepID=UPI000927C319|nr:NAD(P)/FAD-dependent oxidoreductase [Rhodococcus sp. M8]OLL18699.1 monooxygenase [Rhodococcus sp. M8]QPG47386.1 NAD(P)/FAD-dependent oxidoreductase [Rhodococcus sp. M8]
MTSTYTTGGAGSLEGCAADDLAAAVAVSDPGALLMSMVHVTGDVTLVDEFEDRLARARAESGAASGTHYGVQSGTVALAPGQFPPEVAAAIRERAEQVLGQDLKVRLAVPDEALFRRMAALCTVTEVDDEFVPLLLEQAGFETGRRRVPVTTSPPADFDVIVVGAGMIGLNAAIKLGEAGFRYTVFEARDEIGGTWSRNTYPGAAVDTPSHYYSYSFELNPDWTRYYPSGPEYLEYMRGVAEKYDLYRNIELSTAVISANWVEEDQKWVVVTRSADGAVTRHTASAVVTALGMLNAANIPEFDGMDSFEGRIVHTAEWPADLDLTGKRVVVLGTGCTAVQVVPSIVDEVASLDAVVRSPHWIVPEKAVVNDVPEGERWAMRQLPYFQQWFRLRAYWLASDNLYPMPRIDPEWAATHLSASPVNDLVMQTALRYLERSFPDRADLREKLTPDFRPYAKRIVKDPGFFAALDRDNVTLHRASFARIHPDGVTTTDGTFIAADVIVLATGFKLEFASFIDITGRDGRKLADLWRNGDDPRAYLGIQVSGFPNLFVTAGPNAAPNHGAGHNITSEEHVHYLVECLQYLVEEGYSAMDVRPEALEAYNRRVDEALDRTVWAHPGAAVTGYYRNSAGRPVTPCPWRLVDYWTMLREPVVENFVFTRPS